MVLVLDRHKKPLMPCTPKRARLLLSRGYKMRQKRVAGFATGDRVEAIVPARLKPAGTHVGRVAVRSSRSFSIRTRQGKVDGINAGYCRLVQRGDRYEYAFA